MSRLLHFLALAAMMLAPMAMHGAETAPAPHHAATAEHCGVAGESEQDGDRGRSADCALACSAISCGAVLVEPVQVPPAAFASGPSPFFTGTAPGSDPPPPRFS